MSWRSIYILLFLYRCVYSLLAQQVISQLTSLGDSSQFQRELTVLNADPTTLGFWLNGRQAATQITESVGTLFHSAFLGDAVMINVGFQTIAFVGIVIFLRSVQPRVRVWLLGLLMLPSFSIWSSVAGKEAIVVFALGILAAHIVDMYRNRASPRIRHVFAALIIFFFKIQYLPALFFILVGTWIARHVHQKTFVILCGSALSLFPIYVFRNSIDELAFGVIPHFAEGGSTRPPFWIDRFDLFWKAPEGMFQAFFGPTLSETANGVVLFASFIESAGVVLFLAVVILWKLPTVPIYMLTISAATLFWILFATYPLGIQNPGSAIRYRTGYEILVFLMVVVFLSKDFYLEWCNGAGKRACSMVGGSLPPTMEQRPPPAALPPRDG